MRFFLIFLHESFRQWAALAYISIYLESTSSWMFNFLTALSN